MNPKFFFLLPVLIGASAITSAEDLASSNSIPMLAVVNPTTGWKQVPFKFEIQRPYDLQVKDRYDFDPTNNIHHFWVYFSDKPHAPPPNKTTARTEMRLETFSKGEHMFDADVNISPGTFACIGQVFDAAHGPVTMLIAHPDGKVTIGNNTVIKTNAIGQWWNLKMSNDPVEGGKIRIYVDNVLTGTYNNRGPRAYYFKCGVYSRKNSDRSEARFRNIRMWVKDTPPEPDSTAQLSADTH